MLTRPKEAKAFFERINKLLTYAEDDEKERLKVYRLEADAALKLLKALEKRNKAVDDVAKKYENANSQAKCNIVEKYISAGVL